MAHLAVDASGLMASQSPSAPPPDGPHSDPAGIHHNLETTSGGHEARTLWYRQNLPMTDRAVESRIYMRTLSRRETVAAMALPVMDFLLAERR